MAKLQASLNRGIDMSLQLAIALYLGLGLALGQLRRRQGMKTDDAAFCGLFWPFDLLRHGIDLLVNRLIQADAA
jgi:hypothetical protein